MSESITPALNDRLAFPPLANWHAGGTIRVGFHGQHLVQLHDIVLEAPLGTGHVQAEEPGGPLTDDAYGLVPVLRQ